MTPGEESGSEGDRGEVVGDISEVLDDDVDSAAVRVHGDRPAVLVGAVGGDYLPPDLGARGDLRGERESFVRLLPAADEAVGPGQVDAATVRAERRRIQDFLEALMETPTHFVRPVTVL